MSAIWYILAVLAVLSAFAAAYLATPYAIKLAFRLDAIDKPDQRKVHRQDMPRMGGLAIFVSFMVIALLWSRGNPAFYGIWAGGLIIFLVGMLDDIYQLSPWVKLIGQCMAAAIAMYFGVIVHFVTNPFDGLLALGYLSLPVTFLWIVGITNAINLIDGLDGLAGGVSAIAAATMGVVAFLHGQDAAAVAAFILVAAIVGFMPYNFHPARTFMGDGGSNFLGFVLACLAIMGTAKSAALISLFVPIVTLGIPIVDTFSAIIRRIHKRAPLFMPDKDHLHHRLMALGISHRRSVLIIYGISAFFGGIAVTLSFVTSPRASFILAVLLLLVVIGADRIGMFTGQSSPSGAQVAKPPRHAEM